MPSRVTRFWQANHSRLDLSGYNRGLFANDNHSLETNRDRASRWSAMMSPQTALHDPVFRAYLLIVPASLALGGVILSLLHWGLKKKLGAIWKTYRSWLVMASIGLLVIFGGRVSVIFGGRLLSLFGC